MIHAVALGQHRQAIVDGMSSSKARALKANARKQRIGLDDMLDCRRERTLLQRDLGLDAIGHKRLVAKLGERQTGHAALAASAGATVGIMRRLGLKVGCERIAHTGNRQAHRARRDNRRIHQDNVGVCLKEEIFIELAIVGVEHRKRRTRGIGRSNGGANDNRELQVIGDGLRGVEDLAATDADDDVATVVASERDQAIDLTLGALAVKVLKQQLGLSLGKTALDLGTDALLARRRHDDEGLSAERLDIGAELGELVRTLDVLAGAIENCSHNYPIL